MSKRDRILEEIAMEDFGRTDIPSRLRGKARKLAREKGITPKEALSLITGGKYASPQNISKEKFTRRSSPPPQLKAEKKGNDLDPRTYINSDIGRCARCGLVLPKKEMKAHIDTKHRFRLKVRKSLVRLPALLGIIDRTKWKVLDERNSKEDWLDSDED
ncbi:MAG: hypothetical protein ACPG43_03265 [Alcanivoracaceae bacterium]